MRNTFLILMMLASFQSFCQDQSLNREIREVYLSGSGYELGLQHGNLLKTEIDEIIKKMKVSTANEVKGDANEVIRDFFNYANFTEDIKKYTPELYEEIKGISDGSGQAINDIMIINLLDEFWVYLDAISEHHCSSMGIPSLNGSSSYIAQNLDIDNYAEGYQILIRLDRTDKRPEQFILTCAGCIGLTGMNEAGVGTCVNTLMQLKGSNKGLPVAFIVRRIVNSTDKEELLNFIQTVPHASGQNYIIGIGGEVYDYECSANKVVRFNPGNSNGTVYHTNHPIVNDDVKPWFENQNPKAEIKQVNSNSHMRLAAVKKRIAETPIVEPQLIKETLRSKDDAVNPVCRTLKEGGYVFTFGSLIMTLTSKPFLQITAGSPDKSEYKIFDFTEKK